MEKHAGGIVSGKGKGIPRKREGIGASKLSVESKVKLANRCASGAAAAVRRTVSEPNDAVEVEDISEETDRRH